MQKMTNWCAKRFHECFSSRTIVLILTFFMLAFCANVHTRWAKSLFYFFLLPVQIGMSYSYIRDKAIDMGAAFKLVCISLLWLLMSQMLNSYWSISGMNTLWTLMGSWIFCLFIPKKTTMKDIHDEIFKIGMVFIVCFLPFVLIALSTAFTGKLFYVPWDETPLGIQEANAFSSRFRIMMNPNKAGVVLTCCIFFSIYGFCVRKKKLWRAFFILSIVANTMGMAHVASRTCIMGLAAAVGMFGFRCVYQLLHNKKVLRILAGVIACALVFLLVVYGMGWILKADIWIARQIHDVYKDFPVFSRYDAYGTFNATGTGRGEIWLGTLTQLKTDPKGLAIGYGAEDVMQMMIDNPAVIGADESWNHVHSAYLDAVIRGGVPYLLMIFAFLLMLIKPAWQLGMEKSTEQTRGLFVIPMFIVALLVMSVSEVMLFVNKEYANFLFLLMCGYLLYYKNLRKEEKTAA